MEEISIVIGSWGSYNKCNERALGSKWLKLSSYSSWEEIEEELVKEGFIFGGIDEELFIQDIEGIESTSTNWDYVSPKKLFNLLYESEILTDNYKYEIFSAYLEIESLKEWEELISEYGANWSDDIYLYKDMNWYDLGYQFMHECNEIPGYLDNYIDYEKYGEELSYDNFYEYSNGIIEIRR